MANSLTAKTITRLLYVTLGEAVLRVYPCRGYKHYIISEDKRQLTGSSLCNEISTMKCFGWRNLAAIEELGRDVMPG